MKELPIYTGTFKFKFDSKRRISIPSRWLLEGFESRYYIGWIVDGYLRVYPEQSMDRWINPSLNVMESDLVGKQVLQKLFSQGHTLIPDAQKRIRLDATLFDALDWGSQVFLLGEGFTFSILPESCIDGDNNDFDFSDLTESLERYRS